ncbi:hypothetical protein PHYSODRAFT_326305 [Phytophthora sojae]|uniref:Uncharacterized protein n=1 Tax=Phytophthora sojae (strain P6497) TaxID=1094619 RepID=G4Z0G6_PHYSP|nr:hypothetical protein PHYSODRAFT_326305 [Phytophthora sojae]EGZ25252.1 hypothetical protein PHYSODRAFT_326305 [Phytophthora sojae]|eukprot:XP_009520540.1 hypothetical protein PHYSODRAFT_326305 [Phytophthora sojae]
MADESPCDAVRAEAARVTDALCMLVGQSLSEKQSSIIKEAVSELLATTKQMQDEHHAAIAEMKTEQQTALADLKAHHAAAVADMAEKWDAWETAILTEVQFLRDELKERGAPQVKKQQSSPNSSSRNLQSARRSPKLGRGRSRSPSRRHRSRSRSWGSPPRSRAKNYVSPSHSSQRRSANSTTSPKHRRNSTYRH